MHLLERSQWIPQPVDVLWPFFAKPSNLNEMTPPFLDFRIASGVEDRMFPGQIIEYRIQTLPGVRSRWITEITQCVDRHYFVDEQRFGPYKFWHHLHRFSPLDGGILMLDRVHYLLPLGPLGEFAHRLFIRRRLKQIFDFRAQFLTHTFGAHPAQATHK